MTAEFLWINGPLMAVLFLLGASALMWLVFRHPDLHPRETRTIPAYLRQRVVSQGGPSELPYEDRVRETIVASNGSPR